LREGSYVAGKTRTGIFLALVIILTVPVLAIETGDYEVRPAYSILPDAAALDPIPVSSAHPFTNDPEPQQIDYSDLPPAILLILAIVGFLSFLVFFFKLVFPGNLPVITGLAKIKRKELLDNASRNLVYTAIRKNPGINPSEIETITQLTNKNVMYHLNKLLDYHMIVVEKSANGKGYFQNSAASTSSDRMAVLHSKNPNERLIIEILLANPGISRKEISTIASISGPSVSWHISRLVSDNIVEKIKRGTIVHHFIKENYKGICNGLTCIQKRACIREN
jgi:predicted transcriptional regulator